jgi:hypothetical protein
MTERSDLKRRLAPLAVVLSTLLPACVASSDSTAEEAATQSDEDALSPNNFLVGTWRTWDPHDFKLAILSGKHADYIAHCDAGDCKNKAIRSGLTRTTKTTADGDIRQYATFALFPHELLGTKEAQWNATFRYWFNEGRLFLKRPNHPALVFTRTQKDICGDDLDCSRQGDSGFECHAGLCTQ